MMEVNIDVSLKERSDEFNNGVLSHVMNRQPFIIYHDKEHYVRINPYHLAMVGYDEHGEHFFQCHSLDEFLIRLKLFIITNENFHSCIPKIEENPYRQISKKVKVIDI